MNNAWWDTILGIVITVVSGVLVFILGEYLKEVWLMPLRQYHELKYVVQGDGGDVQDCINMGIMV